MTSRPDFSFEDQSAGPVCGIDEVGRGPLAGPVVAAAVILHRDRIPKSLLDRINDSKKLSAPARAEIFAGLGEYARIGIGHCTVEEIDALNILRATHLAMFRACEVLDIAPELALVDGNRRPDLPCNVKTIVKGDTLSLSIAAASIVAKHHRDCLMRHAAQEYPAYGWDRNAGYGTAHHLEALRRYGLTPWHRLTFTANYQETITTN